MFNIIEKTYLWLVVAIIGIFGGGALFFSNLRLSIDFTGGLDMKIDNVDVEEDVLSSDLEDFVASFEYSYEDDDGEYQTLAIQDYDLSIDINEDEGYTSMLLAMPMDKDAMVQALSEDLE